MQHACFLEGQLVLPRRSGKGELHHSLVCLICFTYGCLITVVCYESGNLRTAFHLDTGAWYLISHSRATTINTVSPMLYTNP